MTRQQRRQAKRAVGKSGRNVAGENAIRKRKQAALVSEALATAEAHVQADRLDEAVALLRDVLALAPGRPETLHLLGMVAFRRGDLEKAEELFAAATGLDRRNPAIWHNLGLARIRRNDGSGAVEALREAVRLKPKDPGSLNALGAALIRIGQHEDAIRFLIRSSRIRPDDGRAWANLGLCYADRGRPKEAIGAWIDGLKADPGYVKIYDGMRFVVATAGQTREVFDGTLSTEAEAAVARLEELFPESPEPALLRLHAATLGPEPATGALTAVIAGMPSPEHYAIGPYPGEAGEDRATLPDRVCALLNFGRSGSGFLHSLVDGHPAVTTLPGVYFKGFFGNGVWQDIGAGGAGLAVGRFSDIWEVLFDARHPKGVPGDPVRLGHAVGTHEGFTRMGPDQATPLTLDRAKFAAACGRLLRGREQVTQGTFFRIVHRAFEMARGREADQPLIFYHLHNPNSYELANCLRQLPEIRLLTIVREPLQACESWLGEVFGAGEDYGGVVNMIVTLLGQPQRPEHSLVPSVAIRLEDIKTDTERTLDRLCAWLDIDGREEGLRRATMQGLEWWGDAASPHFGEDPFHRKAISRKIGRFFDERDQFVLGTLLRPFRERMGYAEPGDPDSFRKDLAQIHDLIDEPFGFERRFVDDDPAGLERIARHGMHRYLRMALRARLARLEAGGDNQGSMVAPLPEVS